MKKFMMFLMVVLVAAVFLAPVGCASKSGAAISAPFTITVSDASGKSVEFTEKEAAKLKMVEVSAVKKKKDGTEVTENWKGVLLSDVLKSCGIESFSKVRVTASDGYEQEFEPAAVSDSGTLLGFTLDGKEVTADDGFVKLVVASMSGKAWVSNVKSISAE